MNYNEMHKISTLYPNAVLLLFAVLGAVLFAALYSLLRKIPFNRYTAGGTAVFFLIGSILLYAVNIEVSKCIAFYGGWDCGVVANSARWLYEGYGLGQGDYYTIYTNNVPITWLLYRLYSIACGLPGYPYPPDFIWIQFQCAMFSAAAFFSAATVLLVSKKIAPAVLAFAVNSFLLGLSPWKIIPYTDAATVAFPVFVMFLYALFLRVKTRLKYFLWLFMVFAGSLGGIMKATCYIPLLAILAVDFLWLLCGREAMFQKAKGLAVRIALSACGLGAAMFCKYGIYDALDYEYDRDIAITWTNYLYNGLNEQTTGACSGDGLTIVESYMGYPREIRDMFERKYIRERIEDKGFGGLINFWLRKQVMNFNDGTFSWFQEGFFNAWMYEELTESSWKEPLRDFYWKDGRYFTVFNTWSQGIWIFILLGITAEAALVLGSSVKSIKRTKTDAGDECPEMCIRAAGIITFTGVFLFVMLFEGRARYLFNSAAVFGGIAVMGYCKLAEGFCRKGKAEICSKGEKNEG